MAKKTYVRLNRTIGATDKRADEIGFYEMIIPVKTFKGFKSPVNLDNYTCGFAFKSALEDGKTVLVNERGGWNFIISSDQILEIYQK